MVTDLACSHDFLTRADAARLDAARLRPPSRSESNPFATRYTRPGSLRYRFDILANGEIANPSVADQGRAQLDAIAGGLDGCRFGVIVGPHGSGKSTLLHTLMPALEARFHSVSVLRLTGSTETRFVQLWRKRFVVNRQVRSFRMAERDSSAMDSLARRSRMWIIDGAEQIPRWQQRGLLHWCRRRGLAVLATSHTPLPGMHVLYRTELSAHLIAGLTAELVEQSRPEISSLVQAELQHRELDRVTNLRDLWFEMYDVVQTELMRARISPRSI